MSTFSIGGGFEAPYTESGAEYSYGTIQSVGGSIDCDIQLKTAEGRLYTMGALSKHKVRVTGGTVALNVDDIPTNARKDMYGEEDSARSIGSPESKSVNGLKTTDKSGGGYTGFAIYAPDDVDGVDKFTAVFLPKMSWTPPGLKFKTMDSNIEFQTPHTVGEFMRAADGLFMDIAVLDTEEDAILWCKACLGAKAAAAAAESAGA